MFHEKKHPGHVTIEDERTECQTAKEARQAPAWIIIMHAWLLSDSSHELGHAIWNAQPRSRRRGDRQSRSRWYPMLRETILYHAAPVLIYSHLPKLPARQGLQSTELGTQKKKKKVQVPIKVRLEVGGKGASPEGIAICSCEFSTLTRRECRSRIHVRTTRAIRAWCISGSVSTTSGARLL